MNNIPKEIAFILIHMLVKPINYMTNLRNYEMIPNGLLQVK